MKYQNIREEEVKNKVGQDFFANFDSSKIIGNIDFAVSPKTKNDRQENLFETPSLLWAEAKRGTFDTIIMFTQLVLTIGKARTFDKFLPPAFLGAFDAKKIAFVPYNAIIDIFGMNDFNWNVTPSNHETKEFLLIKERIEKSLYENHYIYDFIDDEKELHFFIKNNIAKATESGKILIDKNNFVPIYLRWLDQVKPSINFDWVAGKKQNIHDSDFYLADLFVDDKGTSSIDDDTPLSDNLFVVFKNSHYEIAKENIKQIFDASIQIKDKAAYEQFWKKYKRPPLDEIQKHIIDRKDLLIPQDIRERKGAFFTPKKWVELSQKYIADVLGSDWQDDYYVWDCAAGTGNLLAGLTNKYNIWASTLDQSDVNAMHDRIENGALLLKDHCFQFDFLNDDFTKLPQGLQDIINDEHKRKKLVVYINPPYAEHGNILTKTDSGEAKTGVANKTKIYNEFQNIVGTATRELFAQFFLRIYKEIPDSTLASFGKMKHLNSQNFLKFRNYFKAEFKKGYVCHANTFDNVKGNFPIGFLIWNFKNQMKIADIEVDVYDSNVNLIDNKKFFSQEKNDFISSWLRIYYDKSNKSIASIILPGVDMQSQQGVYLTSNPTKSDIMQHKLANVTFSNLIQMSIYFCVRQCIDATWLNDRDQFLYPNDGWQNDLEFQNDCLAFSLFYSQNRISGKDGVNNWIPFTEQEVNSRDKFESNFMTQFIKGKIKSEITADLFVQPSAVEETKNPLKFSQKATAVFDAGRELYKYYHAQPNVNVNGSLYDIREHFQGRNEKGKMNNKSQDVIYMKLITALRDSLKILAKKIEPKVYEFGFLKE